MDTHKALLLQGDLIIVEVNVSEWVGVDDGFTTLECEFKQNGSAAFINKVPPI